MLTMYFTTILYISFLDQIKDSTEIEQLSQDVIAN